MKKILILQRAIPNYRLPLFQALCNLKEFEITIGCDEHDATTATGIPADNYSGVRMLPVKIHKLGGKFLFQQIVSVKKYDVVISDISVNIISVPVYIVLCKLFGVKFVGWGKGVPQLLDLKESWFSKTYKKIIASCCNALILYGGISHKYFQQLGLGKKPMFIAQNSVHTEKFYADAETDQTKALLLKKELGLTSRFVFGYFGKLTSRKAVDKIIEAFRIVRKSEPAAFLLIAGTGADTEKLKTISSDLIEDGSIKFLGKVKNGDEGTVLHVIDAYLSFSQGGLGILEAMATGRIIISTPEIFPETELLKGDYNCLLSTDFSVTSFADAMKKAITNPEVSKTVGENALKTVKEKAGTNVMVKAFEDAINHLIRNK